MDYLGEAIALGIDTLLLGVCLKQYFKHKNALQMVQGAPFLDIDNDLEEIVRTHPDQKLCYVSIRGIVKPLGNSISSTKNNQILGVIQKLTTKEHVIQRSSSGFWSESERTIKETYNVMPFSLSNGNIHVEIADPLASDILDLDIIYDNFEPTIPNVMDHIWGFFSGMRQRGVQNTEEMLRCGTLLTGIGELCGSLNKKSLRLQPPSNGAPFYLTTMPITSLVRKIDERRRSYRWLVLFFGTMGLVLGGLLLRRYWKDRQRKLNEDEIKKKLEVTRRERRRRARENRIVNDADTQCVVCRENPRETIIIPCGHVCLCEDCSINILDKCPVCRQTIENKLPAYIA